MNARPLPLAFLFASVLATGSAGAAQDPGWTAGLILDPRPPLEIGHPLLDAGSFDLIPVPVLFAAPPEFELFRVNLKAILPTATSIPIVLDGSIFAIGPVGENSVGTWGGSYIDNFELRFWRSNPPHDTVENFLIDDSTTWVDSSSGVAGPNFFASGVDFATGKVRVSFSATNGTTWNTLRTLDPGATLYVNFDGGERVSLWVDPDATDPQTTRNCLFYETITGGTTSKRINCADGAAVVYDGQVTTDIPSPGLTFDKFIENRIVPSDKGAAIGMFSRRSDQSMNNIRFTDTFQTDTLTTGAISPSSAIFSIGAVDRTQPGDPSPRVSSVYPDSNATSSHIRWFYLDGTYDDLPGPPMIQGPVALARRNLDIWVFYGGLTDVGFEISGSPAPIFGDGVNDGTFDAWSTTVP